MDGATPNAEGVDLEHGTFYLAPGPVWEEEGRVLARVQLWLELDWPCYNDYPSGLLSYMEVSDDRGSVACYRQSDADYTWSTCNFWKLPGGLGTGWTRYQGTLELTLDHTPRWVELSYPYGGNNWTLRAEWEVEE